MYIKYTQERDELRQSVERLSLDNSRHIEHVLELEKLYSSLRGGPREEQGEGKGGRNAEGGRGGGAEGGSIRPEIEMWGSCEGAKRGPKHHRQKPHGKSLGFG